MRVGNEPIKQHQQADAAEECQGCPGITGLVTINLAQRSSGLRNGLDERDVHHRTTREGQRQREMMRVRLVHSQGKQAAQHCSETCAGADAKRDQHLRREQTVHPNRARHPSQLVLLTRLCTVGRLRVLHGDPDRVALHLAAGGPDLIGHLFGSLERRIGLVEDALGLRS